MTAPGRPTLEQVAERAGVGRGTVSRVVNGAPQVAEATRRAVEAAIAELGYTPNPAARALVTRRTGAVALVISEPGDRVFAEPFFAAVVRGIGAAVEAAGRQLVLTLPGGPDAGRRTARYLTPQHVDGVLLVSLHEEDPLPGQLLARGLPVVLGGRPPPGWAGGWVDVDNVGGATAAVAHLLARGRRRIATVAGPADTGAGHDRLAGYRTALDAARVPADPGLVLAGDFSQESGRTAVRELLHRRPDVDAVFAANDPMALGALQALREAGRQVPDDVAVVGFDDSPAARATDPPLSTVRQPVDELGRRMAALLLRTIAGADAGPPVVLPTEVVVRASS